MTNEESKQAIELLKKVRTLKSEYEAASKKVTELMEMENGFSDQQLNYKTASEISHWMNIEHTKYEEYIKAKQEFRKFMAEHNITFTSKL